jgi:hypothetical protein
MRRYTLSGQPSRVNVGALQKIIDNWNLPSLLSPGGVAVQRSGYDIHSFISRMHLTLPNLPHLHPLVPISLPNLASLQFRVYRFGFPSLKSKWALSTCPDSNFSEIHSSCRPLRYSSLRLRLPPHSHTLFPPHRFYPYIIVIVPSL